jgi:hypothetical protein
MTHLTTTLWLSDATTNHLGATGLGHLYRDCKHNTNGKTNVFRPSTEADKIRRLCHTCVERNNNGSAWNADGTHPAIDALLNEDAAR